MAAFQPSPSLDHAKLKSLNQNSVWRSIPTCHPTKNIFYPDELDEQEQAFAQMLSEETSQLDTSEPTKNRWYDYGDNEPLEFSFRAVNLNASRFSKGFFPVWYGASNWDTSKAEVTYHRQRQAKLELAHTKTETILYFEWALCKAHLITKASIDLRSKALEYSDFYLENGPPYPFCNELGQNAKDIGTAIIQTLSRRWKKGEIFAVMEKDAIISSVVKAYWDAAISKDGSIHICSAPVSFIDGWMQEI